MRARVAPAWAVHIFLPCAGYLPQIFITRTGSCLQPTRGKPPHFETGPPRHYHNQLVTTSYSISLGCVVPRERQCRSQLVLTVEPFSSGSRGVRQNISSLGVLLHFRKSSGLLVVRSGRAGHSLQKDLESCAGSGSYPRGSDIVTGVPPPLFQDALDATGFVSWLFVLICFVAIKPFFGSWL